MKNKEYTEENFNEEYCYVFTSAEPYKCIKKDIQSKYGKYIAQIYINSDGDELVVKLYQNNTLLYYKSNIFYYEASPMFAIENIVYDYENSRLGQEMAIRKLQEWDGKIDNF